MGSNNSQPEKEQTSNKKPQSKDKKGKGNDQALAALKLGSGSLGTLSSPQSKMKAKERKKIEKIMEEFKSTYPELQTDQDFNPLTMDLAISQGLHIDFVRETAKIQLQFTPILKKSSLLEVKLLYLKKEFWRNSYEVWSHINNQQLMIVNSSGDEYRVNSLPATCGYSEFVLKVDKKSSGQTRRTIKLTGYRSRENGDPVEDPSSDTFLSFNNQISTCCCWDFSKQKLEKLGIEVEIGGEKIKVEENPNELSASDKYQINFLYSQNYQKTTQDLHHKYQTRQAKSPKREAAKIKDPIQQGSSAGELDPNNLADNQVQIVGTDQVKLDVNPSAFFKEPAVDESQKYFLQLVALISAFCIEMNKRIK